MTSNLFAHTAKWYDDLNASRDYDDDVRQVQLLVQQYASSKGNFLLDVACGTGRHLASLQHLYNAQGIDRDPAMLAIAQARCPKLSFYEGDMRRFDLGKRFDVITCLSRSTGAAQTGEELTQTMLSFARHLAPGGIVIVEPWLYEELDDLGKPVLLTVEKSEYTIARMYVPYIENNRVILHYHYLVGTTDGVQITDIRYELGLLRVNDYLTAFDVAGLEIVPTDAKMGGRQLYVVRAPLSQDG